MAERGDVTATQRDTGASLYDVTVVLREIGYLPEERAPYNVAAFTTKPTVKVKAEAAKHKVSDEMGVAWVGPDVRAAQVALANGLPVVFGMTIHQSFLHLGSDRVVEMPTWRDRQAGGHAMILTGYDADREVFMLQNSWGPRWGKKGYSRD
ncbi:MAG: C1 family peptidase [Holosporaceae bacterium]|nr:MAG: C1 family peptidase [Holosporaceae bacterium]